MARISMCDRCENVGNGDAVAVISYRSSLNAALMETVEICPTCYETYLAWLTDSDALNTPRRAFRKPTPDPAAIESAE